MVIQDEGFLDSRSLETPRISEPILVSTLQQAAASRPAFGAQGIRMLNAWLEAARQALASICHDPASMYQHEVLERLCRGVAKLRLSQHVEECDVVIGINLYEESRIAKGLASMLGWQTRSNGRQNIELLDRDPILAHTKLRARILSICQSYGTHSDGGDEELTASGAEEDDWAP